MITHPIVRFDGTEYKFLSNFYPSEVSYDDGMSWALYPTVEHAYQAAKTFDLKDRGLIKNASTPYNAKRLGSRVKLRDDWELIKSRVMFDLVWQKFTKYNDLKEMLIDTGNAELIEGNTWADCFFGVPEKSQGRNVLGKILMLVRDAVQNEKVDQEKIF